MDLIFISYQFGQKKLISWPNKFLKRPNNITPKENIVDLTCQKLEPYG